MPVWANRDCSKDWLSRSANPITYCAASAPRIIGTACFFPSKHCCGIDLISAMTRRVRIIFNASAVSRPVLAMRPKTSAALLAEFLEVPFETPFEIDLTPSQRMEETFAIIENFLMAPLTARCCY